MVNLSIHDQTTAHTAAERNIKCRIISLAGTLERLTQRRDVRVVIHAHGHPRKGLQPSREVEFGPTFNLMRATDFAGFPIDRSSKTDAKRSRFMLGNQFRKTLFDLAANAGRARIASHDKLAAIMNVAMGIAGHEL